MNIDVPWVVVPDGFCTVEEAVVVNDGQGTGRWVLQKLGKMDAIFNRHAPWR